LGKKWVVQDLHGNTIYLTHERWQHITENHPEMEDYSDHLKETIKRGRRQQEPLDPRKYRYIKYFEDLVNDNNHIVAIAMFKLEVDEKGNTVENNFILTAYQKYMKQKR
jgi:preprotein translocase subunit SecA